MFCRKCGDHLPEHVTVCDSCSTRIKEATYCHKCATELPANSTRCTACNAKSRAHKSIKHWLPAGLSILAIIFTVFGGFYYFDEALGAYNYDMPYATMLDYLSFLVSVIAFIMSVVYIPRTRLVLKIFSIVLSGFMLFISLFWLLEVFVFAI